MVRNAFILDTLRGGYGKSKAQLNPYDRSHYLRDCDHCPCPAPIVRLAFGDRKLGSSYVAQLARGFHRRLAYSNSLAEHEEIIILALLL